MHTSWGRSVGWRPSLTPAERRVLRAAAAGLTRDTIAADLGCSRSSVGRHLDRINTKCGATGLVAALGRIGWLVVPD